jgi:hypothetical protein
MVVAGQSQRVRASGVPVLHGGLVAVCEPNGTKLTVVQTQRRVSAD